MGIDDGYVYDGFNAFTQFQAWGAAVEVAP